MGVTTDDIDLLLAAWSDMQVAAPPQMTENLALLQENAQLLEAFKPPKMAASRVFNDHLKTGTPAHSRYQVLSSVSLTAGMVPNERLLKGGLRSIDLQVPGIELRVTDGRHGSKREVVKGRFTVDRSPKLIKRAYPTKRPAPSLTDRQVYKGTRHFRGTRKGFGEHLGLWGTSD